MEIRFPKDYQNERARLLADENAPDQVVEYEPDPDDWKMTPDEHYRKAEDFAEEAYLSLIRGETSVSRAQSGIAQVHATLATVEIKITDTVDTRVLGY